MPLRRLMLPVLAVLAFASAASPALAYRDVRFTITNMSSDTLSVRANPYPSSPAPQDPLLIAPNNSGSITGGLDVLSRWDLVAGVGRRYSRLMQVRPFIQAGDRLIEGCLAGRNPVAGTPHVAGGDAVQWDNNSPFLRCTSTPAGQAFDVQLTGKERSQKRFILNGLQGSVIRRPDSDAYIEYAFTIQSVPPVPRHKVIVSVNDPAMGRVVSVGSNVIDCGTRCSAMVPDDTEVPLRAIPAPGFRVAKWSGVCMRVNDDDDCQAAIIDPIPFGVTFEPIPPQTLSLTTSGSGSGRITSDPARMDCGPSATCTVQFLTGATVTLRAFPDAESTFGAWTGPCAGSGDTCTVTLSAATQVGATFNLKQNVTVAASVTGSGLVRGDGGLYCRVPPSTERANRCTVLHPRNASITLTAEQVDPAQPFSGWSTGAPGCSTAATCMPGLWNSIAPVASFAARPMTVRVRKTGTGTGRVTGPLGLDCGSTCGVAYVGSPLVPLRFNATPDAGSSFTRWEGTCSGSNGTCRTMSTGEVVAVFTADPPPPTAQLVVLRQGDGRGGITSDPAGISCGRDCSGTFGTGSTVTLTARADASSIFAGWQGACSGGAASCAVQMDASRTAVAVFQPAPVSPPQPDLRPDPSATPLVVPEPGPNPPSADAPAEIHPGAPGLRALAVTRRTFHPGQGTVVRYRLDHSANVTMTFAYGKSRRPRYRYTAKSGAVGGDAGANAVRIVGRVRNRDVSHGRWIMRVTARNAQGTSRTISRVLTVR